MGPSYLFYLREINNMLMDASTIFIRNDYYTKLINLEIINNILTGFLIVRNLEEKYYYKQKLNIQLPDIIDIINGEIIDIIYNIAGIDCKLKILYNKERQKLQILFDNKQIIELD